MKAFHEIRSYDSNFVMWHSSYHNISFLAHWHNELELIYVSEGNCPITINDDTFHVQEGDLLICNSGDIHYCDASAPQNKLEFLIFDPAHLDAQYRDTSIPCSLVSAQILKEVGLSQMLRKLFKRIPSELQEQRSYYQEICVAMLREFWYMLKRILPKQMLVTNRRGEMMESFHKLLRYFDTHYAEQITLEAASAMLGYTPSHFSKIFKKLAGINFVTYLSMIRAEEACTLLKKGGNRMIDIAQYCGFNNLRTFNRTFKEIIGCTPTQFKELPNESSYALTYYKRRSMDQTIADGQSPTVINHVIP